MAPSHNGSASFRARSGSSGRLPVAHRLLRLQDGDMRARALTGKSGVCIVALALLAVTGCSATAPDRTSPSRTSEARVAAVDATFTCADSFVSGDRTTSRTDLRLGPLTYANGASLAQTTLAEYFAPARPEAPADGGYFLKMGASLPPGESLTVRVDPANGVRIVGASGAKGGAIVRYDACLDRGSAWVGGLELERSRSSACASFEYRTAKGKSGRVVASIFAGRCPA